MVVGNRKFPQNFCSGPCWSVKSSAKTAFIDQSVEPRFLVEIPWYSFEIPVNESRQ